jgi:hypothetical protein
MNQRLYAFPVAAFIGELALASFVSAEVARISISPAVSTVVDRTFVESLPLNGRSFQSLISMTPGVVLTAATSVRGNSV